MMDRRRFLLTSLAGAVAAPLGAGAQQAGKVYRVGLIFSNSPVSEMAGPEPVHPLARAFMQSLQALGYVEERNLILERRTAEGHFERFEAIVAELVRLKADVIVTVNDPMTRAAKAVTTTVPIVMTSSIDPVGAGAAQSLARPGGNVTGLAVTTSPEVEAKRLALLRETLPRASRIAYLDSKEEKSWNAPRGRSVQEAALGLGVTLLPAEATPGQYSETFAHFRRSAADALFVGTSSPNWVDRALIVDFAIRTRLPGSFPAREYVDLGGLMCYGANLVDQFRRAAVYVDKILKGARPADLPIEQPTKFDLIINLKTAKALGLTIPPSVLARADQVIE